MPQDEDALSFEDFFCLDDVLREVLSLMLDLSPHVVDHERLREVEFVIRKRHCLEVQGHSGTTLEVTELVSASRRVAVSVEEASDGLAVLREVGVVETLVPFLIVVDDVVGVWREQLAQFLVCKHSVENPDFIHGGLSALVSDASKCR